MIALRRSRRHAASARLGHTLVEMVLVVTFFSLLITLATRLIMLMYDRERAVREQVVSAGTLDRLAHQFQRDVRAAEKILRIGRGPALSDVVPPDWNPGRASAPGILRLQVGETVVEYAETAAGVTREARHADARQEREIFRVPATVRHVSPDLGRVEITMQPNGGEHSLVTLRVRDRVLNATSSEERDGNQIQQPAPRLNVQAVLGADLRFAGERAKEGK